MSFNPFLYFCFVRAHLVAVDAEAGLHVCFRVRFADVAHYTAETASFMGGEGIDGFAVQVVRVEKREHHLRVRAPPDRSADEDEIVLVKEIFDV